MATLIRVNARNNHRAATRRLTESQEILEAIPSRSVMVVGDLVADEFVYGEISRVSREAPVLILKYRRSHLIPGGGGNAVCNVADLGATVIPAGVVGDDPAGQALLECFRARGIDTSGIIVDPDYGTTTKTRILAGTVHGPRQQVLRIDREPAHKIGEQRRAELEKRAVKLARRVDAVLVSDYGYGTATPGLARALRAALNGRPLTLDSRYDLTRYAGITAATPNEPEVEEALRVKIGANTRRLEQAGRLLLRKLKMRALLITRGRDGMVLFEPGRRPVHIPIHGSDEVTDVTGAGDTVIAAFTSALGAGATYEAAARLANVAGGIVVMKRGTATASREEMQQAIGGAFKV